MPLDDQCLLFSVGPEGLEPSPARLRAGDAAANTLVPSIESARWELNPRPASYKDAALTIELRASESRAGGNRTHTIRIKSPPCCQLHHNPKRRSGVCVSIDEVGTSLGSCLFASVVALRIELSTTRLSAVSGRPALDYHSSRAPRSRTETLLLPKQACSHLHLCPFVSQNGRDQSDCADRCPNRRSRDPQSRAIPGFATF